MKKWIKDNKALILKLTPIIGIVIAGICDGVTFNQMLATVAALLFPSPIKKKASK